MSELKLFTIDNITKKCRICTKNKFPSILCGYESDDKKDKWKDYVCPDCLKDSLDDESSKKLMMMMKDHQFEWEGSSSSKFDRYFTKGTEENDRLNLIYSWESEDAFTFMDLNKQIATSWKRLAETGFVTGMDSDIEDYLGLFGNNLELVKAIREQAYKNMGGKFMQLYVISRIRGFLRSELEEALDELRIAGTVLSEKTLKEIDLKIKMAGGIMESAS